MMPHVMIVEDEPRLRELLGDALRSWGMTALMFRSGEEALRVNSIAADIVLLDLNLPGMDGLEMLAQLRQRKFDAPAIVLTGYGDLSAAQRAIELGVTAFLTKPCRLGELEQAIDRCRKQVPAALMTREGELDDTPEPASIEAVPLDPTSRLDSVEREHILRALAQHAGNRTATAIALGISRRTLQYRLAEYERAGYAVE